MANYLSHIMFEDIYSFLFNAQQSFLASEITVSLFGGTSQSIRFNPQFNQNNSGILKRLYYYFELSLLFNSKFKLSS